MFHELTDPEPYPHLSLLGRGSSFADPWQLTSYCIRLRPYFQMRRWQRRQTTVAKTLGQNPGATRLTPPRAGKSATSISASVSQGHCQKSCISPFTACALRSHDFAVCHREHIGFENPDRCGSAFSLDSVRKNSSLFNAIFRSCCGILYECIA